MSHEKQGSAIGFVIYRKVQHYHDISCIQDNSILVAILLLLWCTLQNRVYWALKTYNFKIIFLMKFTADSRHIQYRTSCQKDIICLCQRTCEHMSNMVTRPTQKQLLHILNLLLSLYFNQ